ncbi:fec operon regulator FecR [compost metagenome]
MSISTAASSAAISQEFDFATLEQAAEWFAVLRSGVVSDEERQQWHAWLDLREEHRLAWQKVESISNGLSLPKAAPAAASAALSAAVLQRRRSLKMLTLLAVTGVVGWGISRNNTVQTLVADLNADYRSAVGEVRNLTLADGSQIWLNTNSSLDQQYDEQTRRVKLRKGEVLIDTNPDTHIPARPFIVYSAEGSLRALGTRFSVRQLDGKTRLSVYEGRVAISPLDATDNTKIIESGQQADFNRKEVITVAAADPTQQAWSQGLLVADNMRLEEFIEELARYRSGYLGCDPAIADLRVVGGFPLNQPEQVLAMLEASLPVSIHQTMPWWVTVRAR